MAMVPKKNVEDLKVSGKRVIVRVDFNVPQDKKTERSQTTSVSEALFPPFPTSLRIMPRLFSFPISDARRTDRRLFSP